MRTPLLSLAAMAACVSAPTHAQVPDGWYVWGSFQGTAGRNGVYFSHPRNPLEPVVEVTNLPPALAYDASGRRGVACLFRRASDGALIAGERAPAGTSVDLHVLRLRGADVVFAQLFSVGTSANVGEIPQAAALPDGRIVVAATDLAAGSALAQFQTVQFNWEGVGILDTVSGGVTPIPITNLNQFPGVLNALAVSRDGSTVYLGNWISSSSGDLWSVPLTGGAATQVATLPFGASNLGMDNDGTVLVTTLNGPPNLFRFDPVTNVLTSLSTACGPLNAIAIERVTGSYVLATANAGLPPRSLVRLAPNGLETLLVSPDRATISALDVNPDPEAFGAATAGSGSFAWDLAPNPGGLPEVGNAVFSLTLRSNSAVSSSAVLLLGPSRLDPAMTVFGAAIHVDPAGALAVPFPFQGMVTIPLGIPNHPSLRGLHLFAQSVHYEGGVTLAASAGVELTVL